MKRDHWGRKKNAIIPPFPLVLPKQLLPWPHPMKRTVVVKGLASLYYRPKEGLEEEQETSTGFVGKIVTSTVSNNTVKCFRL